MDPINFELKIHEISMFDAKRYLDVAFPALRPPSLILETARAYMTSFLLPSTATTVVLMGRALLKPPERSELRGPVAEGQTQFRRLRRYKLRPATVVAASAKVFRSNARTVCH